MPLLDSDYFDERLLGALDSEHAAEWAERLWGRGSLDTMHETKKMRRVLPSSVLGRSRNIGLWDDHDFTRAKKIPNKVKADEDSWAELLGEPTEPAKLVYEKGAWNFTEDDELAERLKDTRNEIKLTRYHSDTSVARFPKRR